MPEESTHVRWLRTAIGGARYVAWGNHTGALYRHLDYLTGLRGRVERAWLRLPVRTLTTASRSREATTTAQQLRRNLGPDSSALLLWTGYYKDTMLVGPVLTHADGVFVKHFRDPGAAQAEAERATMMHKLADAAGAVTTLIPTIMNSAVTFPLVDRQRLATPAEAHHVATRLAAAAIARAPSEQEQADRASRATQALEQLGSAGIPVKERIAKLIQRGPERLAPAHGDITPWNVLIDQDGRAVLIDYDEAAWLPAYFDVVYAHSHVEALSGRVPAPTNMIDVLRSSGLAADDAQAAVVHGLSEQVMRAADSLRNHPLNSTRLRRQVEAKLAALEAL
jgi:hypothetical protein